MLSRELEKEYKNYKKEEWSPTPNYFLKLKTAFNGPFKTTDYMYILCQGVYCTKHGLFFFPKQGWATWERKLSC